MPGGREAAPSSDAAARQSSGIDPGGSGALGEVLEFELTMSADADEKLLVDYVVDFVKKNGSTRPKVFKLKQFEMANGESRTIVKKHRLPASATTFTLYPGTHRLSVMVNGNVLAETSFELSAAR